MPMAGLIRLQTLLRHVEGRRAQTILSTASSFSDLNYSLPCVTARHVSATSHKASPTLRIHPEQGLCDEIVDITASGLTPGQLVTLQAQVYTEDNKYRFLASGQYKAGLDGMVKVHRDASLGGSFRGVQPMGLFWSMKPAPEVAHKHPRLVKWDVTRPFTYTIKLVDGIGETEGKAVLDSKMVERRYIADYVEQIPLKTGGAEGILFLPKQRGSSDPLPFVIDIRGLLSRVVVDRAALLASYGFAVFAFDYFMPRRMKTTGAVTYMDGQAFLDIVDFVKQHPRLDENRIGISSSCYGGSMMMHAATRLPLPVKCLVGAGFLDTLCVNVGWRNLDGSLLEPLSPFEDHVHRWYDENGKGWITFKTEASGKMQDITKMEDVNIPVVENLKCPLMIFGHGDDTHIPSLSSTLDLKDRLEAAGKGHLVDYHFLPGTGHFLEAPFQSINTVSSLFDPVSFDGKPRMYYTMYGGDDTQQAGADQQFAWGKIINFFCKHLGVKERYRTDWT